MKGKAPRDWGKTPPVLAVAVLLLALGVVATTPLAFAKYTAQGTGAASGTVAKWAPEVEAPAWGKTVLLSSYWPTTWVAVTDRDPPTYTGRNDEWTFRPNNTLSEVAAKFTYSIATTGTYAWLHLDATGTGTGTNVFTTPNFRTDNFAPLAADPTPTKKPIFVYVQYNNTKPYAYADCYATATFSWTAEQID
jgi:hypothetical protein